MVSLGKYFSCVKVFCIHSAFYLNSNFKMMVDKSCNFPGFLIILSVILSIFRGVFLEKVE